MRGAASTPWSRRSARTGGTCSQASASRGADASARPILVLGALERRYGSFGLEMLGGSEALRARLARESLPAGPPRLAVLAADCESQLRAPR